MAYLDDLKGKAVLVTGSSTGIGAAVAKGFAACGAAVAVHCNASRAEAEAVVAAIRQAGGAAVLLQADVTKTAECTRLVDEAATALGGLDVLVNNAGGLVERTLLADWTDELFDKVIDLNVRSVMACCKAAVPHMRKRGGGAIINTGSIAARHGGGPGTSTYASTKGYVHTVSKSLSKELVGDNIRVNTVSPGVIFTPFHKATPKEAMEGWAKAIPQGRLGTPEDMVGAYLFLASDSMSAYVTGQTLDVNGGFIMP